MKLTAMVAFALVFGWSVDHASAGETDPTNAVTTAKAELVAPTRSVTTNELVEVELNKLGSATVELKLDPITVTNAPLSGMKQVLLLFNPFAPLPPEPGSKWRERTGWAGAMDKTNSARSDAIQHEPQFSVTLVKW